MKTSGIGKCWRSASTIPGAISRSGQCRGSPRSFRRCEGAATLLIEPDVDLFLAERQQHALGLTVEMHNHSRAVLQPKLASATTRQSGRATGLRVATAEIADLGELVHLAGSSDFLRTARADHGADEREGIALAVEGQGAAAAAISG